MNEFEAKAAIREVLGAYSGAASRLDVESFCRLFIEDAEIYGVVEMFNRPGPLKGHEQIKGFFGTSFNNLDWLVQLNNITDVVIDPGGGTATASVGLVEMAKRKSAPQIMLVGRYDDRLKSTAEGWRFTQRRLSVYRFAEVS
jgi:ketosteroid isomerase-like protein